MQRTLVLVPFAASLLALSATAQTGRTMRLLAPVVIGQTASIVMEHSPSIAGNYYGFAMCSPTYPGAIPVSVPGVSEGVLRLNPVAYGILVTGVLDASGQSPAFVFQVPNDPLLVGATFDVQGADEGWGLLLTLSDNDLEIEIAAPPPAILNMVPIAAGTFQMGSPVTPLNQPPYYNKADAQPVHAVTITRPFWMGKYEVTQAEYQAVMGSNPSFFQGANWPVEQVTWNQAVAYCDALTVQEAAAGRLPSGYEYRLPTEAEWEYCCRAGTTTEFHYGSTLVCGQANFGYSNHSLINCGIGQTAAVGSYAANAWGLHDMHGNVMEWCLDSWDGSANYPAGSVADPYVTSGPYRVFRGGNRGTDSYFCRAAFRFGYIPEAATILGFRVVCAPVVSLPPLPASLNMVAIAPGTFLMGSPVTPLGVWPYYNEANTQPVQAVTITQPFWIGKFEVTQAEYQAMMGYNPSQFKGVAYPNSASQPVETVSWSNAVAYCDALTAQEAAAGRLPNGYEYRLPTEAEWEYCCRAGTTTEFAYGTTLACGQERFSYSDHTYTACSGLHTAVVGSYAPNPWGLHDMHGNVWEWCINTWVRGGAWGDSSRYCRSASRRSPGYPAFTHSYLGFRVVCAPVLP